MNKVRVDTRLKDADKDSMRVAATNLMRNRRSLVPCPWSEDPYAFYMGLFPADVKQAMRVLTDNFNGKFKGVLHQESNAEICIAVESVEHTVEFKFGRKVVVLPTSWPHHNNELMIKAAHPGHQPLAAFCTAAVENDGEACRVGELVDHVMKYCNTYGQVHRLWPELLPIIGGVKVAAAEKQQRRSALPRGIEADDVIRNREAYTFMLAQGAVLPDRTPVSWVDG